jgi:phage repressor protein C with HTH and peptisase S24 domain
MSRKKFSTIDNRALASRIQEIAGSNSADIARRTGVTTAAAWGWLRRTIPSVEALQKIAMVYSVNLVWLITGQGEKYVAHIVLAETHAATGGEMPAQFLDVPCVLIAMAGAAYIQPEHIDEQSGGGYFFKRSTLDRWDHLTTKQGKWMVARLDKRAESMAPTLQPGDIILVNRRVEKFIEMFRSIDGKIFLIRIDEGVAVKRLLLDGRILEISSDNRQFRSKHIDLKNLELSKLLIGQVIWHGGDVK